MPFLVRLKPLSVRKGHVVRCYMVAGVRFYVDRGWYDVDDDLAEMIRPLKQDHYDSESADLFDVATREEAARLDAEEAERVASARASAANPASIDRRRKTEIRKGRPLAGDDDEDNDLKATDVRSSPLAAATMLDPDPEGDELDAQEEPAHRVMEVGRVKKARAVSQGGPRTRAKKAR